MIRTALKSKSPRGNVSELKSRSAPVKGWNARDPVASMKPDEAIELINWYPTASDVMVRKGATNHVTGITGQVETLMPYNASDGTQTLFCAAGTAFYNVTAAGAVGASVQSGLANARWQYINFTNSSGTSYLCCFNGIDSPRYWNGTTWITITGVSAPAITGVTPTDIISASVHKRRMWLLPKNGLKAYYLPVDSVGGAAAAIDLSGICSRGGYIMAIDTWTLDAGSGVDDLWVAVTSEGEVVVYQGIDPSSATDWSLNGVWHIGQPIGRRCLKKFGGDLLLTLVNGVFPLSKALLSAQVDKRVAMTNRIETAMNEAATAYGANFGWEVTHYPANDMLVLNVPVSENTSQEQYVMNVITGAWCNFTDWHANCFEVFDNELYYGSNGTVVKAWNGTSDNSINIESSAITAFDYFDSYVKKSFKMVRPIFSSNGSPSIGLNINVDYEQKDSIGTLSFSSTTSAKWGIARWGISKWASGLRIIKRWIGVSGLGLCASTRLKISSKGIDIRWKATDYTYEKGSGIV